MILRTIVFSRYNRHKYILSNLDIDANELNICDKWCRDFVGEELWEHYHCQYKMYVDICNGKRIAWIEPVVDEIELAEYIIDKSGLRAHVVYDILEADLNFFSTKASRIRT